jgi:hypothetical protein
LRTGIAFMGNIRIMIAGAADVASSASGTDRLPSPFAGARKQRPAPRLVLGRSRRGAALLTGSSVDPARLFMATAMTVTPADGHSRLELKLK